MPRVPTYDNLQVAASGATNARFDAPEAPDIANKQLAQAGQSLMSAGSVAGKIALDVQEQANKVRAVEAAEQLETFRVRNTYDPEAGFMFKQGAAAIEAGDKSLPQVYGDAFNEEVSRIESTLANDAQKFAFRAVAGQKRAAFSNDINRHVYAEFGTHQKEVFASRLSGATNRAGLEWSDPAKLNEHTLVARATLAEWAKVEGVTNPDHLEALRVKALSPLHLGVAQAMIDAQKPTLAKEYLKQNGAEMTNEARLRAAGALDAQSDREAAQAFGDEVFGKGLALQDALAEARTRFSGKTEDEAVAEVTRRFSQNEAARVADARKVGTTAWTEAMETGRVKPATLAELREKAPEEERQIRDWQDAKNRQRLAEAKGNFEPDLNKYQGLVRMSVEDPEKFAQLDFAKTEPYLGKGLTKQLIDMSTRLSRQDAKSESERSTLKTALALGDQQIRTAGIDLRGKPGSPEAETAARFTSELLGEIATLRESGKVSEPDIKATVMRLTRTWYTEGKWYGHDAARGFEIPPDQWGKVKALPYSDIPAATVEEIRNALLSEGKRPTEISKEMIERRYTNGVMMGAVK